MVPTLPCLWVVCLFVCLCTSELSDWTLSFQTTPITSNSYLDPAFTNLIKYESNSGYLPSVDPNSVDKDLEDIVGYWPFDTQNVTAHTSPDLSEFGVSAKEVAPSATAYPVYLPTGGRFGGAYQFNGQVGQKVQISPSPVDNSFITNRGIGASVWVKPTDGATGTIYDRIYSAMSLFISASTVYCANSNGNNKVFRTKASAPLPSNYWSHIVCTYDPASGNTTMFINGTMSSTVAVDLSSGFYFGTGSYLTVGGSYSLNPSQDKPSTNVTIDDVVFYSRAITPDQAQGLYQRTSSIVLNYGPSFRSQVIPLGVAPNYWDVTPMWYFSPSGTADAIRVEISTNRGVTWCPATNGTNLGLELLANYPQEISNSDEPTRNWPVIPIGINEKEAQYYTNTWTFVDIFKNAAPVSQDIAMEPVTLYPRGEPAKGSLLTLVPGTRFPDGTQFTLRASGTAKLRIQTQSGNKGVNMPQDNGYVVANPNGIVFDSFNSSDPIRNITLVQVGYENATSPIHPYFLERFAGVSVCRFMDSMKTNGNQQSKWKYRTRPDLYTQDPVFYVASTITSITDAQAVTAPALLGDWKLKLALQDPHEFVTGQTASIDLTQAVISYTKGGVAQNDLSVNGSGVIEVIDDHNIYFALASTAGWPDRSTGQIVMTLKNGNSGGRITVKIEPGISIEYLIQIAIDQKANPWFNIPLFADDDYILQMATLIKEKLPSSFKAYIEYSNEIWNTGFSQTTYLINYSAKKGITKEKEIAMRLANIFTIFGNVYGAELNTRIVKICPGFAAGTSFGANIMMNFMDPTINPKNITLDVLSIAPYFGGGIATDIVVAGLKDVVTPDEILDRLRDTLYSEVIPRVANNYAIAQQYGLELVAYEGGQGLAAPVYYTISPAYDNLTHALQNANRHPRMKDIYKQMFWLWGQNGGALFNHYNYVSGPYGTSGSWGVFESQDQPTNISYKYQALVEMISIFRGTQPPTTGSQGTSIGQQTTGSQDTTTGASTGSTGIQDTSTTSQTSTPSTSTPSTSMPSTSSPSTSTPSTNTPSTSTTGPGNVSAAPATVQNFGAVILCVVMCVGLF